MWKLVQKNLSPESHKAFQKDLIVWKLVLQKSEFPEPPLVSEGLNSVETPSPSFQLFSPGNSFRRT